MDGGTTTTRGGGGATLAAAPWVSTALVEEEEEDEGRWGDQTIEVEYVPHNRVLLSSEEGEVIRRHGKDFNLGGRWSGQGDIVLEDVTRQRLSPIGRHRVLVSFSLLSLLFG